MPAPEQSPVTEEGLLLTIRDGSAGRNMEAENTANNILASVKEQVACPDPWNPSVIMMISDQNINSNLYFIKLHTSLVMSTPKALQIYGHFFHL